MCRWMDDVTRDRLAVTTLILIALVVAAPLWGPGIVNTRGGGDSPFLLQRTHQMLANLQAGVFPVRWMPDAAYGLGYPFFSYYSALPYYLAGLLALARLDLLTALKLVQTVGFVSAGLAMYGWMRGTTRSRWMAWLAAVAYTVAPFHLVNVYVRGDSLSEFYAFVFYPLVLWGLDQISHPKPRSPNRSPRRTTQWVWAALAYAGLILTHNISAMLFSPFALLYLVMLAWREETNRWRVFGIGIAALAFGFLLAAWYGVPALTETSLVQLGPSTQDYFHYSHHFRTLNLIQGNLLFDYSTATDHRVRSPFAMGLLQAGFAILGGLVLVLRGLRRRLDAPWAFVLLGFLISTAMITPLSKPLWDHLPLLSIAQFPWRFLSVQALFAAAATAALVPDRSAVRDSQLGSRGLPSTVGNLRSRWVALPVAACLALSVLLPLHPERLPIGPADVTVERLQLYELFAGNIGTTIRYEWLPQTVDPRPFTSNVLIEPGATPQAIPLDGASVAGVLVEQRPTRQVWQIRGEGGGIAFPLLYWPGWAAQVDGSPVEVWPVEGSGYAALQVPPGDHIVLLRLERTPVRAVAEAISLAATAMLLVIIIGGQIRKPRSQGSTPRAQDSRHGLIIDRWSLVIFLTFVILPLVVLLLLPREALGSENDLTMDFEHMPYLHHNPGGVDFGEEIRLAGYRLSANELAPGDTLTATLNWAHVDGAATATLRLLSPAAVRHEIEPLAEETCDLQSAVCNSVALRLPEDISRGIYLLQLRLFGPQGELHAQTSRGKTQGALYLQPVRVPHGPSLPHETSVLAAFGPAIQLHGATVAQFTPGRLAVRLAWSTERPVAANHGISLRLLDAEGQRRVSLDTQPGYGFLPTSLWRPGELVTDPYILVLPDDLPSGGGYQMEVVLYQVPTLEAVGQARLGDFSLPLEAPFEARQLPRSFSLPSLQHPVEVDFGGEVRLAGYDLEREAGVLRLTLWWQALQPPQADHTVFVHLFDPATEALVAQNDAQPRVGMYPTSWWAGGEVVSDTVTLPLTGVPQGTYHLAVGLYDQTVTRLPAIGPDGQRLPDDRVILPESVETEP
jgi:hypothetical protein